MDTPRTDAYARALPFTLADDNFFAILAFARQLERELNDAYERAAKVCDLSAEDSNDLDCWEQIRNAAAAIRALKPK
jgi:hypothetical protein